MDPYTLVLNAGSSSLKFCLFRQSGGGGWLVESRGQFDGIGSAARLTVKDADGRVRRDERFGEAIAEGRAAIDTVFAWLQSHHPGGRLVGVGHRVVHGGRAFNGPAVVTSKVLADLHALTPLAPLHQPHNLAAIEFLLDRMPDVPQVACFDTSFHHGHAEVATLVPLPRELRAGGVERYGFHGLSYEYVASVLPEEIAAGRVIIAHLGNGASLCALRNRKSIDTTMSFTALDGLCMGTRPGSIDSGVVLHLVQQLGLSAKQLEDVLYKRSGLLGISGISNDMRDLLGSADPAAKLAVDYFIYRAAKEIGSMAAVLGGLDALVFTAGIGENSPEIRRRIMDVSAWLGIEMDAAANAAGGPRITTAGSRTSAWVIPTNEEAMIARHTQTLLGLEQPRP